jgi:hypothetical protein
MNDAIGHGGSGAKAFEVGKIAAMDLGAGLGEGLGAGIGAGKTDYLMTCGDEFVNYG